MNQICLIIFKLQTSPGWMAAEPFALLSQELLRAGNRVVSSALRRVLENNDANGIVECV
ncbi:MAG: hypothetical protein ISR73_09565 [Gammaproteobacteria bacterium]|nr:hypothetical protein [Gammaproteobacteria bacterium]